MQELEGIVGGSCELGALPGTAMRLTSLLAQEDWSLDDIVHAIAHDPALTGRLLRLANSAAVGGRVATDSVGQAVMRVGSGPVLSLALANAVREEMMESLDAFDAAEGELWRHSVAAALALGNSAKHCEKSPPAEGFVAALLHDIGFLAMDRYVRSRGPEEARQAAAQSLQVVDHAVIGGLIAAKWSLSDKVQQAIVHHHAPSEVPDAEAALLSHFVCLADCVAHGAGAGFSPEKSTLTKGTAQALGLTREGYQELCNETRTHLDEFLELYS